MPPFIPGVWTPVSTIGTTVSPIQTDAYAAMAAESPDLIPATGDIPLYKIGDTIAYHPTYTQLRPTWLFLNATYRGGPDYKFGFDPYGDPVFVKHERESDTGSTSKAGAGRRQRIATFQNYCAPIINQFNDHALRRKRVKRDDDYEAWTDFLKDVDALGTDIVRFVSDVILGAQKYGRHFVAIQSTRSPEDGAMTLAQATAAGVRVFFDSVDTFRVIDWRRRRKQISEIVVVETDTRVVHYTAELARVYEVEAGFAVKSVTEFAHGFAGLPVIEVAPFSGQSQMLDMADLNRHAFNLKSLHDEELWQRTFSQLVAIGCDPKSVAEAVLGTGKMYCISDPLAKVETLGLADVAQAESIRTAIADDIREIYRIAGLRSGDPLKTAEAQSGIAKAWDFEPLAARLAAIATEAARAERWMGDMWSASLNTETPDPPKYPDNFDATDLAGELAASLDILVTPQIPPAVKKMELSQLIASRYPEAEPAEVDAAMTEADDTLSQGDGAAALAALRNAQDTGRMMA